MFINTPAQLIYLYRLYLESYEKVLVGHPNLEEVRVGFSHEYPEPYNDEDIGRINPHESAWWKPMAQFLKVEFGPKFPLSSLSDEHYLFGEVRKVS
jgi:hypothetical protein